MLAASMLRFLLMMPRLLMLIRRYDVALRRCFFHTAARYATLSLFSLSVRRFFAFMMAPLTP